MADEFDDLASFFEEEIPGAPAYEAWPETPSPFGEGTSEAQANRELLSSGGLETLLGLGYELSPAADARDIYQGATNRDLSKFLMGIAGITPVGKLAKMGKMLRAANDSSRGASDATKQWRKLNNPPRTAEDIVQQGGPLASRVGLTRTGRILERHGYVRDPEIDTVGKAQYAMKKGLGPGAGTGYIIDTDEGITVVDAYMKKGVAEAATKTFSDSTTLRTLRNYLGY